MNRCAAILMFSVLAAGGLAPAHAQDSDPLAGFRAQLKNPDSMFTLIVEFHVKPGTEAAFREAAGPAVQATRREAGNAAYEVHQDVKEPTRFVFFEKWRSLKALEAHVAQEHTKTLLARLGEISESPMTIRLLMPSVPGPTTEPKPDRRHAVESSPKK
jgi:quinol monooxygenase YgiN